MDEPERRALTVEYLAVKTRLKLLRIGFWIAVSLGGGLVFVGELWIGVALWIGVGLLLSAAAIRIAWSDFVRGPVQRQRERVEAATEPSTGRPDHFVDVCMVGERGDSVDSGGE
jgi:hypothetical protein